MRRLRDLFDDSRVRARDGGQVIHHKVDELEAADEADHDDDPDTDHLARLDNPFVLRDIEQLEYLDSRRYGDHRD
jgi:hypothetical protein